MNLDNDRNPIAPHHPSDAPPRRSAAATTNGAQTEAEGVAAPARSPADAHSQDTSADDGTTSSASDDVFAVNRTIIRAILSALPLAARLGIIVSLLNWCRAIIGAATARLLGAEESTARAMAVPVTDDLTDTSDDTSAYVCAIVGAWFYLSPFDAARMAAGGAKGDAEELAAFLVQLRGEVASGPPENEPPPAAVQPAPAPVHVIRCAMPEGVDRIATRDGRVFVPSSSPPVTREVLSSLVRDVARALADVDPNNDRDTDVAERVLLAQRAALAVHAETHGPVASLAGLGAALSMVADHEAAHVEGPDDALTFCTRAGGVAELLSLAARAFDASRRICLDAGVCAARWPAE